MMTMPKVLIALLACLVSIVATARSYDDVMESGELIIGLYRDFPPYSYELNNQPQGIDVDIAREIAKGLNLKPVWYWITPDETLEDDLRNTIWKGPVTDADKKVADVMMRVPYDRDFAYAIDSYGIPKNDLVVMYGAYHAESWEIARNTDITGDVRTLANFAYDKIGVELATLPDYFLMGWMGGRLTNKIVHFGSTRDAVSALKAGEVAAVVGMSSELRASLGDDIKRFDISRDGLQEIYNPQWDIGVASHSNFRQLSYAIGDEIARLIDTGMVQQIFERHQAQYLLPSTYTDVE